MLLIVLLSVLLDEVFEISTPNSLDRAVTLAVRGLQTPFRDRVLRNLTNLGDYRFLVPATLLLSGFLAARGRRVSGLLFAGAVVGGFLLESAMKIALHRSRPDLWPALVTEKTFSFPSGHATMTTLFFGGAAAVVFHMTRRRLARVAAVVVAAVLIAGVAFSRVYLGCPLVDGRRGRNPDRAVLGGALRDRHGILRAPRSVPAGRSDAVISRQCADSGRLKAALLSRGYNPPSMRNQFLPFARPSIGDEEIAELIDTLRSGWITTGPKVERFTNDFVTFVEGRYAVPVSSATAGLHVALLSHGSGRATRSSRRP